MKTGLNLWPGTRFRSVWIIIFRSTVEQAAKKVQEEKQADSVSVLLMNPQDGEIFAMVNAPEFNLNTPFELIHADREIQNRRMNRLRRC